MPQTLHSMKGNHIIGRHVTIAVHKHGPFFVHKMLFGDLENAIFFTAAGDFTNEKHII